MKKLTKENYTKGLLTRCAATFPLILCFSGFAAADPTNKCNDNILRGQYVFTATGFTRPSNEWAWHPLGSQGDPRSPPFQRRRHAEHASGHCRKPVRRPRHIVQPPSGGGNGAHRSTTTAPESCKFADANSVTFKIYVDPPQGDTIWMIQTNPLNNVFQGTATKVAH